MSSGFNEHTGENVERHSSRCLFCTLGCGFDLATLRGEVVGLEYAGDSEVNRGALCSKGKLHPRTDRPSVPAYRTRYRRVPCFMEPGAGRCRRSFPQQFFGGDCRWYCIT